MEKRCKDSAICPANISALIRISFMSGKPIGPACEPRADNEAGPMIYLNTLEEGGKTSFPELGFGVSPRAGPLLMWNNMRPNGSPNPNTLHEARPSESGRKYSVTKGFR